MKLSKEPAYRIHVALPKPLLDSVKKVAAIRRVSVNSIVIDSLKSHLEDDLPEEVSGRILSDLGRIDRKLGLMSSDVETLGEFVGLYVLHWLCHLTPLSESEKRIASIEGRERFNRFITLVKEKRVSHKSVWALLYDEPKVDGAANDG